MSRLHLYPYLRILRLALFGVRMKWHSYMKLASLTIRLPRTELFVNCYVVLNFQFLGFTESFLCNSDGSHNRYYFDSSIKKIGIWYLELLKNYFDLLKGNNLLSKLQLELVHPEFGINFFLIFHIYCTEKLKLCGFKLLVSRLSDVNFLNECKPRKIFCWKMVENRWYIHNIDSSPSTYISFVIWCGNSSEKFCAICSIYTNFS